MNREKCTAVVLAAGKGSRMGTKIQKQYLEICGKPVLYYSLAAFAASPIIDEIVLVTGEGKTDYCRKNIIEAYGITKVNKIVVGGKERYESVYKALREIEPEGYVFIHDGARPFVDESIIERTYQAVKEYGLNKFAIAGGVASNSSLRAAMKQACEKNEIEFYYPSPIFCTDNAAMIGVAAYYEYINGTRHGWDLNAVPNLKLGER